MTQNYGSYQYQFKFCVGQQVYLHRIETCGIVRSICVGGGGLSMTYKVEYWNESKLIEVWVYDDDLTVRVPETQP